MKVPCAVAGLLVFAGPLLAQGISPAEYRARRAELRKSLEGAMVLFGAPEPADLHSRFFQETNFLYLSGWREPGAIMMLTPGEEILFLPPRNPAEESFTGPKTGFDDKDAPQKSGFDKVLPAYALETNFLRALESSRWVYLIPDDPRSAKLKRLSLMHEESSAAAAIANLRMIKSPTEIELITAATNATVVAHLAAWRKIKPGFYEYQIAAAMVDTYMERGCERSAYAPIVGSGPDSVVLHYMANRRRMDSGEVVLMDVGAECADYATDVTRTVPVNGKFTPRQREIYDIVLGAQQAAIAAIRPGIKLRSGEGSLQQIAYDYINTHGKDLHGDSLGKYFTHGLSHYVGLDVHDPGDLDAPLKPGMVITIEPGIYLPEENLGVRIEDTILVTADGSRNLSEALPRDAQEIERLIGK